MLKKIGKAFYVFICAILIFQLTGCGTLMYPERKGQKTGRIDAGVAVMDGLCLLLFIIPGIIAYAVDFSNGTIYLPGTSRSSLEIKYIKEVKFDPKHSSMAAIEEIVKKETGCNVKLYENGMKIVRMKSSEDMLTHFAEIFPGVQNARIVLLNK